MPGYRYRGDKPLCELPPVLTASLFRWTNWVLRAYDLAEHWPACWYRHEGLVIQFLALRRWHAALGTDMASDPTAAIAWHDALYRLEDRARSIDQTCLASHRDSPEMDDEPEIVAALPP